MARCLALARSSALFILTIEWYTLQRYKICGAAGVCSPKHNCGAWQPQLEAAGNA